MNLFRTSESIDKISPAFVLAQSQASHAAKDSNNPHFRSTYASLESVIDAIKDSMKSNKLACLQAPSFDGDKCVLITKILHESGQYFEFTSPLLLSKNDMQGLGSSISYMRRYSLAAVFGLGQEDDDGNKASNITENKEPLKQEQKQTPTLDKLKTQSTMMPLPPKKEEPVNHAPSGPGKISEAQVKRLHAIMKAANTKGGNWSPVKLNSVLAQGYAFGDALMLSKKEYDELCNAIESGTGPEAIIQMKVGVNINLNESEKLPF